MFSILKKYLKPWFKFYIIQETEAEAELRVMLTVFAICTLLGSLQVITAFIDTSNYKILFDRKNGDVAYWDTQCRG